MSSFLKTAPYRGTRDFLPAEMSVRQQVFHRLYQTIERYGFARYDGPILESAEIYEAKSGREIAVDRWEKVAREQRQADATALGLTSGQLDRLEAALKAGEEVISELPGQVVERSQVARILQDGGGDRAGGWARRSPGPTRPARVPL